MGACLSLLPSAYSTHKEVKLLDRKLGILYSVCILLVLGYVIGVRLLMEKGYNGTEKAYGIVGARLQDTRYNSSGMTAFYRGANALQGQGTAIPYDMASLVQMDEGAGDAIFLPTRILVTREQQLSNCTDPDDPCTSHSDCSDDPPLSAGQCAQGHCVKHAWCNASGTTYASSARKDPFSGAARSTNEEVISQVGGNLNLTVISSINFPDLGTGELLSTEDAARQAKIRWDMAAVLQRAGLPSSDAIEKGGVLGVTVQWDCNDLFDESDCAPHLLASQLAEGEPFMTTWAHYYRRGSEQTLYRDLYQARGLRLLLRAEGTGERIDPLQLGTQLFVMLALFPIAAILADSIMQQVFSERRHYREYKTEISPDFSDVRAKVEQLEKQSAQRQAKVMNYAA